MLTCEWSENPCPGVVDGVCKKACFTPAMRTISERAVLEAFPLVVQQQAQHQDGQPSCSLVVVRGQSFRNPPPCGEAFEGEENPWAADQGS